MARPKKTPDEKIPEQHFEKESIYELKEMAKEPVTPEQFLTSKGIGQPPITSAPLQGQYALSYDKLIELLNEFKNA